MSESARPESRGKFLNVRMNPAEIAALKAAAKARELPMRTLARSILLRWLADNAEPTR